MGKKKLSLKPVQRGFATTSIAAKKPEKPVEEPEPEPPAAVIDNGEAASTDRPSEDVKADWEDEKSAEEIALQALVDKLQEKGEREVTRIVKAIEYDKRLATSFPRLEINQNIRDKVLQLALEEESPISISGPALDEEKALTRAFVTYHVLAKLGFTDERIVECLKTTDGGWGEALEWMWLNLSEDECLNQGEYAGQAEPTLPEADAPLEESSLATDESEPHNKAAVSLKTPPEPTSPKGPLFQSLATSESDSDDEVNLNKYNETWASLMIQMDGLRIVNGKKKKGKPNVVLETPEIRHLKGRIALVEKEYMFNRKDADTLLKALRAKKDAQSLEDRLRGKTDYPPEDEANAEPAHVLDDTEGDLFGGMLDEPEVEPAVVTNEGENTSVTVRSMPIPKQFSFAGDVPKSLLRTALGKSAKQAIITYASLSGGSRVARAGLEIRWTEKRRRVWRMENLGCDGMAEAENYVSTLALNELVGTGELTGVNWRSMPAAYKDLWEELEITRRAAEDKEKRAVWSKIKQIVDSRVRAAIPIQLPDKPVPSSTASETSGRHSTTDTNLQADYLKRVASKSYQTMRKQRDTLPIASFREQIISTLDSSQIMVLSGETGCGKSTQLPSFILEDQLAKGQPCKIFVTEPRRISAISLAQRVSQELGDSPGAMGTNASLVGYSIRLEAKTSASTRLAFVTNGIALRMLEGGSKGTAFDEITHIIVDEVHERSIESDFLLIVLKSLVEQRKDLKVVLMSATLDAEKISNFFGGVPCLSVPGRTFPVQVNYLEDAVEAADWHIDESSVYAIRPRNAKSGAKQLEWDDAEDTSDEEGGDPSRLAAAKYSARTVSTVNLLDSRQIPYDLIVNLLEKICFEPAFTAFSAATLVFMPGLAEIRRLNDMLQGHPVFGSIDFIVYPLHSTISSEGQSAVFDAPPKGVRKIVISTNIAETGVTIPDITCVIDSGKHREMRYDEKRQISRLVETYIARSNAKQRRGRAGRVQEGIAFHLFTRARHDTQLAEHPVPEMLRLSLQDLALRIKILKLKLGNTIEDVLTRALDPPSTANIQRAIAALVEVKALTANEEITPMGRLLSKLPMDVHLGKFLLVAALFKCLDPALTIAATLNAKSPFVTPFGHENAADAAKRGFAVGNSDFLTIANVFDSWRKASDNPNFVRTFCKRNYVSQQNLQQIEELRQQLLAYLLDSSFIEATASERQAISQSRFSRGVRTRFVSVPSELNVNATNVHILGGALASGLYPKILSLDSNGLKTIINQQPVAIHPSSINFRTPKSDFGTNHLAYFTIMQSKRLYAWETGPVDDRALALLCGEADFRISASSFQIDRKVRYKIEPKTALAIKRLREQFAAALSTRLRGKRLNEEQEKWFELGLECLKTGRWDQELEVGVV